MTTALFLKLFLNPSCCAFFIRFKIIEPFQESGVKNSINLLKTSKKTKKKRKANLKQGLDFNLYGTYIDDDVIRNDVSAVGKQTDVDASKYTGKNIPTSKELGISPPKTQP